ncbi:MAG: hypothetical protein HY352_04045 [Candidatus Omnitrophica bacterium]|nr:hypothetical protein [Candidatus Omnitrophota bacterium]
MRVIRRRVRQNRQHRRGVLLVEILFAIGILMVAGLWLLTAYQSSFQVSELGQQTSVALDDLRDMMERIKSTPFNSLTNDFPSGAVNGIVGLAPEKYGVIIGGYTLTNEQVTVTHQPNTNADPREMIVRVTWVNRGRTFQKSVSTIRASRAS